jgi:UPF0716 protein FxsA
VIGLLFVLFLVVPIAELAVIIRVGQWLGVADTIALLIIMSMTGAWLAKREGLAVLRRIQHQLEMQRVPGAELLDAGLILLAGALLLTPGFLTDVVGILLILPPIRAGLRRGLRRYLSKRFVVI